MNERHEDADGVPVDVVQVPREPTPAMVKAGEQLMGDNFEYLIPEIYRAMIAAAGVLGMEAPRYVWAWMHEEDEARVISAAQKAQALSDGGASASSVKPYSIPLYKDTDGVDVSCEPGNGFTPPQPMPPAARPEWARPEDDDGEGGTDGR